MCRSNAAACRRGPRNRAPTGTACSARRPGTIPLSSGNCTVVASATEAGEINVGRTDLGDEAGEVGGRAPHPVRGRAASTVDDIPSGCSTASSRYCSKGMPGSVGHCLRRHLDAGVGVDPRALRLGDRLGAVESVSAGMGQQVAQRAARLADRLIERDDALLDGDEARPGGDGLGDRGDPERVHAGRRWCRSSRRERRRPPRRCRPATSSISRSACTAGVRRARWSAASRPPGTRDRGSGGR